MDYETMRIKFLSNLAKSNMKGFFGKIKEKKAKQK